MGHGGHGFQSRLLNYQVLLEKNIYMRRINSNYAIKTSNTGLSQLLTRKKGVPQWRVLVLFHAINYSYNYQDHNP